MNYYQKRIVEITKCSVEDAPEVESIMRHTVFHSTLDWQTREEFESGANIAYEVLKLSRGEESQMMQIVREEQ
jgi:hypothetical protein